jgi:hypothetical protein
MATALFLVNVNVSDEYGELEHGYRKCEANLEVLGISHRA